MAKDTEDRGDETTSDESGDTDDLKTELEDKVDVEVKIEDKKEDEEEGTSTVETKEPVIPKSRFDQAVKKARSEADAANKKAEALEAQLQASQGKIDAAKVEEEIDELELELEKAVADGNVEAKKRIRTEIRAKTQSLADARAAVHAQHATAVAIEQVRYDALVASMETEHTELNPDNEETYDEEVVSELQEYKEAFEAKGLSSSEALRKALKAVYREGPKPEAKKEPVVDRKEEAVKKGLEAKGKQPSTSKTGLASDKAGQQGKMKNPEDISDKDWDKLDEAEKKRMRGDTV